MRIRYLILFLIVFVLLSGNNVLAYDTATHRHLTAQAIDLFTPKYQTQFADQIETYKTYILEGSELEDEELLASDENMPSGICPGMSEGWDIVGRHPYCNHFWDIRTNTGYVSWDPKTATETKWLTADKRAKYLYEEAVTAYKNGDYETAFLYLGRVAHLVQDMAVPAHTLVIDHSDYDSYEHYMTQPENYKRYTTTQPRHLDFERADKLSSPIDILRSMADISNDYPVFAMPLIPK